MDLRSGKFETWDSVLFYDGRELAFGAIRERVTEEFKWRIDLSELEDSDDLLSRVRPSTAIIVSGLSAVTAAVRLIRLTIDEELPEKLTVYAPDSQAFSRAIDSVLVGPERDLFSEAQVVITEY